MKFRSNQEKTSSLTTILEVHSRNAYTAAVVGLGTPNAADFIAISGGCQGDPHPQIVWRRGALRLGTAGSFSGHNFSEKLRITEDGHVGIGVPAPVETLEVAGTVKATDRVASRSGFIPLMKVCSRFLAVGERYCGNVS